jgi:uncharacterized protein (TIRG00374 family)
MPQANRIRANAIAKILTTSARLLVTAGLIWLLARRVDLGQALALMRHASPALLAATIAALVLANVVVALRWHVILAAAAASPGPAVLAKLVFVGLFFNNILPTGIGGDAVRAWRCRQLGIALATAINTILLDRAWGYMVMVVLYAAALPRLWLVLPGAEQRAGVVLVFALALAGLVALVVVDRLPRAVLRLRLVAPLARLSTEARRLFHDVRRCSFILGMSILSLGLTIAAFKLAADANGVGLSLGIWAMVVPPVTFAQLLPVSLAGWGVREAALVVVLGAFAVPPEAALAISVLLGLCLIVIGLPGGLIWLFGWDVALARRAARGPATGKIDAAMTAPQDD